LSGKRGASFDRNRLPSSPIAVAQQAALLTMDTACHGVRSVVGAVVCLAATRVLASFHISLGET
jgi:hypothetical protein